MLIGGDFISAGGTNVNYIAEFTDSPVYVKNTTKLPSNYRLNQNYPNPFNPSTVIRYALPEAGNVLLEIYNILGERVTTLVNEDMNAGIHEVNFNAQNFSSGVYFYRLKAGNFSQTKQMILLK